MKNKSKLSLKALLLGMVALGAASATASAATFRNGEVIVKYKAQATRTRTQMNALYTDLSVKHVRRFGGLMKNFEQLTIGENIKVQDAIADLMKRSDVEYAQPNYLLHTLPVHARRQAPAPAATGTPCYIPGIPFPPGCDDSGGGTQPPTDRPALADAPDEVSPPIADPALGKAYGITKIGAPEAWKRHRGDKKFIVAVIDTGIDYNHEDLAFNVWRNPSPTRGDLVGFDFVHGDGLPFDDQGHGTHTSGTVGAVGGNGKGVSGVSQRVSIMAVKFLSAEGGGTTADAIRAIDYAIENGARVLSNSWGGTGDDNNQALHEAIDRAKAKNVLFVAASGNDGVDNDSDSQKSYPAAFDNDNLISVAATDQNDSMASFSNFGVKTTHIAAPGVKVYSTAPGNKYKLDSGTSMACPHVAGAAALIWSYKPSMTYKQVKDILMKSVDAVPSLNGKVASGGRLNVSKALDLVRR